MATAKQTAANRENSKKSTGPTTPEGKAKSSLNHLSHGFTAATHFLPCEKPEDFDGLLDGLLREYQPATETEQILVEKMVHNQWLSLRAIRLQNDALRFRMELGGEIPKDLGLLIRYQTACDRAFHKAHAELLKAQKEREKSEIGFDSQNALQTAEAELQSSAEQPQNPPVEPQKPAAAALAATSEGGIQPGFTPPEHEMAAGGEKLPQAA